MKPLLRVPALILVVLIWGPTAHAQPPAPAPPLDAAPISAAPAETVVARRQPAAVPVAPSGPPASRPPRTTASISLIAVEVPEPRPVQVHDLVTILVNEQAELTSNSQFNRQRRQSLEVELAEFVRLVDGVLVNAAQTSPAADASFNGRIQNIGQVNDREGIRYRITATVVSILPNGNVVLEARKEIVADDEEWEYTLTGTIASDKINRDMTALAENCANLRVARYHKGRVADSTKRSWGTKLFDAFFPF